LLNQKGFLSEGFPNPFLVQKVNNLGILALDARLKNKVNNCGETFMANG
jgi:hypothetical protein